MLIHGPRITRDLNHHSKMTNPTSFKYFHTLDNTIAATLIVILPLSQGELAFTRHSLLKCCVPQCLYSTSICIFVVYYYQLQAYITTYEIVHTQYEDLSTVVATFE